MPLMYVNQDISSLSWYKEAKTIISICDQIHQYQFSDGSLEDNVKNNQLIEQLTTSVSRLSADFDSAYISALVDDLKQWQESGLHVVPDFSASFNQYRQEENQSFGFFLFPVYDLTYKTRNVLLEACFLYRNENHEIDRLRPLHPYAVFQGVELLMATNGFIQNNIFTFFPENIALPQLSDQKKFAYFYISNYLKIFKTISKPLCSPLFKSSLSVFQASEDEVYDARCAFSFVHDHYHYQGVLPFDEFYTFKTTLLGSFFEELRVDARTYVELLKQNTKQCTMASEIILLERLFRYSYTNEPSESFDTLTNYFFLHYLLEKGSISIEQMRFSIDPYHIAQSFEELLEEINALEIKMLCSSPERFEEYIISWAGKYLEFDTEGKVQRTMFADWLKEKNSSKVKKKV